MKRDNSSDRPPNADGVKLYTDPKSGRSGISQSGLAILCGVDEKSVRNALNSIRTCKPFKTLESLVGRLDNELFKTRSGLMLLSLDLAGEIIRYYYRRGKCTPAGCRLIGMPMLDGNSPNADSKRKPRSPMSPEKAVQQRLHETLGGSVEVSTEAGRIDLLTGTEIVEIKNVRAWKSGIGQLLVYGTYYPSHAKRLHLFGDCHESFMSVVEKHCDRLGIVVTWEIG